MKLRTIRDAAEMLGVNENRVRRAARDGRIPSMQLGNRTLVDVDAARGVLSPEPEGVKIDVVSEETGLTVTAILSSSGTRPGYWRSCDEAEIRRFVRAMSSHARSTFLALRSARRALKKIEQAGQTQMEGIY